MDDIPIILLAAGSSSRMGQPKQLLPWGDKTLIEFQVEKLLQLQNPVIVVLGSGAEKISPLLQKYAVQVVINSDWEKGMGTSVAAGMKQIQSAKAALFALVDQPFVTVNHLRNMIDAFQPEKEKIVVSRSQNGWLGVPALFDPVYFEELKNLKGAQGAKTVIKKYTKKLVLVNAGDQLEDMDTPEKYQEMLQKQKSFS